MLCGSRWGGGCVRTSDAVKHGSMAPEMPGLLDSSSAFLCTRRGKRHKGAGQGGRGES